jgi:hypothetical protein
MLLNGNQMIMLEGLPGKGYTVSVKLCHDRRFETNLETQIQGALEDS